MLNYQRVIIFLLKIATHIEGYIAICHFQTQTPCSPGSRPKDPAVEAEGSEYPKFGQIDPGFAVPVDIS